MSGFNQDMIVAPITGALRSAVAIIRVSGKGSWSLAKCIVSKISDSPNLQQFVNIFEQGESIDEGYLTLFEEGRSYTGEESFELSCHGSPQIVNRISNEIIRLGAREARPGEFTERAFINGRIDLTQAEAVRETIESVSELQQKRANELRSGKLFKIISELENDVAQVLALAEATVDFSEEIGELDKPGLRLQISTIRDTISSLKSQFPTARLITEGIKVAIIGKPNVGKSSLLNAISGFERAIVTDIPGTTRDTIEEKVFYGGIPITFLDTAGIRETEDKVESFGVHRSKNAIESADCILFVFDSTEGITVEDNELLNLVRNKSFILIENKIDLTSQTSQSKAIGISAITGAGIPELMSALLNKFQTDPSYLPLINQRHFRELEVASDSLGKAIETLSSQLPVDLVCIDLRDALLALGRITGSSSTEDILDQIFSRFCIGK